MKKRIEVGDLELGMFVAELDRPWLGSPFLFQGFTIATQEELVKLRGTCTYVYVDDEVALQENRPAPKVIAYPKSPRIPVQAAAKYTRYDHQNR